MKPNVLNRIQSQSSDPAVCLRLTLSEWLSGIDPYPTWEALAQALETRTVKEDRLAKKVRETFLMSRTTTHTSTASLTAHTIPQMAAITTHRIQPMASTRAQVVDDPAYHPSIHPYIPQDYNPAYPPIAPTPSQLSGQLHPYDLAGPPQLPRVPTSSFPTHSYQPTTTPHHPHMQMAMNPTPYPPHNLHSVPPHPHHWYTQIASAPPYPHPIPSSATPTQDPMTLDPMHHTPTQRPSLRALLPPYTAAPLLHAVDQYAKYLRAYYRRKKLPTDSKWPPTASKKYIHLAVVKKEEVSKHQANEFTRATLHGNIEDIIRKKESLDFSDIGKKKDGSPAQFILVEGGPGIGKTTFAWKVCRMWSKGKILQKYRLVVLLRLRDKRVREARTICDLLYYTDDEDRREIAKEVTRSNGESVLLLYEGFDELPGKLRTQESVFLEILHQECLPDATILITSRPSATQFLHDKFKKSIDQHIEILGFTKADVQSYVQSVIEDQQLLTEFTQYLKCYPHVRGLMYVPLNAVIVTEIYKTAKMNDTEEFVPTTLTELYTSLSRGMLLRYLKNHNQYGKQEWKLTSFSDLPEELHKQFHTICGIALRGILKNEFIFDDLARDFNTLDLMQSAPELYVDKGVVVSHNFFHLTLQEFLAAVHVSEQPKEEQLLYLIQSTQSGRKQLEQERERERERVREREQEREQEGRRERQQRIEPYFYERAQDEQEIKLEPLQAPESPEFSSGSLEEIYTSESSSEYSRSSTPLSKPHTVIMQDFIQAIQPKEPLTTTPSESLTPIQLSRGIRKPMVSPTLPGQLPSPGIPPPPLQRPLTPDLKCITKPPPSTSEGVALPPSQSPLPPIQLSQLQQALETQRLQGPEPRSTMAPPTSTSEPPTNLVPHVPESEFMEASTLPRQQVLPELQLAERKIRPLQETPQVPQTTPSHTTQDQGRLEPLQVPMTRRPTSESTHPRPESPAIPDTADIGRLQLETPQLEPPVPQQLLSQREVPPITNPRPVIPHTLPVSPPAGPLPYAVLTSSHFQNVVTFTAGLTKLKGIPTDCIKSILLQDEGDKKIIPLYSLHWLFEAQCISKYSEMIGETATLTFKHTDSSMNPFNCFVLGFALSHINSTWDIDILGSPIGDEGLEMMVAGMNYKVDNLPPSLKSVSLILYNCTISSVGLSHLKEMPEQVATRITELDLSGNEDISEGVTSLLSNLTSLKRLNLAETSISTQEAGLLAELLSHSQSHKLEYLRLSHSLKSPESTSHILRALANNTTLREIDLWGAHVSENNLSLLTSALRTNTTLRKLDLSYCDINDNMVSEITSALCDNSTLQTLDLEGNAFGRRGATALAEMLRRNKTLRELYVRGNSIGDEGTLKLATSLKHNKKLEKLVIDRKCEPFLPPELPLKAKNRITFD